MPPSFRDEKDDNPRHDDLYRCVLGFLFSYTALIAYQSDFDIAKATGLLPKSVSWKYWKQLTEEFLPHHSYAALNPRYWYGELRLTRLNNVYRFKGSFLRGYSKIAGHAFYVDIIRDNFATLAGILVYVVIVLTAMQIGLATDRLATNPDFQNASYGLTIATILVPLIAVVAMFIGILVLVCNNWSATKSYERRRFGEMGVEPLWLKGKLGNAPSKT